MQSNSINTIEPHKIIKSPHNLGPAENVVPTL